MATLADIEALLKQALQMLAALQSQQQLAFTSAAKSAYAVLL